MEWFGKLASRLIGFVIAVAILWGGNYVYHVYIKKDAGPGTNFFSAARGVSSSDGPAGGPKLPKQSFSTEFQYPFANGWPYQIVSVPGSSALQTYSKLCKEGRVKGFWPILLGGLEGTAPKHAPENFAKYQPVAQKILAASATVPWAKLCRGSESRGRQENRALGTGRIRGAGDR